MLARTVYCWRCRTDVAMLDEDEWERVAPGLANPIEQIKSAVRERGMTLKDATHHGWSESALDEYFRITGCREPEVNKLFHHRLSLMGPPCRNCGKHLRTPRARLCVECGASN